MGARGLIILLAWQVVVCAHATAPATKIDFDRQIRPILSDKCYHCHGPDAESRQADLRLDRGGDVPEYVIAPGDPGESELIRRIMSEDDEERMPPPDSHLTLSAGEKELLVEWIREGAEFTEHWSFRPLPKSVALPQPKNEHWARNEIDQFVLTRLEHEGLEPSPPANPLRLLRRATLDITGLPPTPAEIRDFELAYSKDPAAAYAAAIDRLLASPAYGEHMAVAWLDAARYADSYGYQSDQLNTQWPFRDWVVRAFNNNLHYDQFLTWQLAGDLLPNSTQDQVLATAFNRLHRLTNEGGSIPEEWIVENASDRIHTFGTAVLALTVECARCHDHKYDPISARDYYSLSAFFNSIDESGLYDVTDKVPTPSLLLPNETQAAALAAAQAEIEEAEAELQQAIESGDARFEQWMTEASPISEVANQEAYVSFEGDLDESSTQLIGQETYPKATHVERVPGVGGVAARLNGDYGVVLRDALKIDRWDAFTVDFWLRDELRFPERAVVLHRTHGQDTGFNGFDITIADGFVEARMYRVWPGNAIGVRSREPLAANEWHHLSLSYDGSSRAEGLKLFLAGKEIPTTIVRDRLYKSAVGGGRGLAHLTIGERFRDRGFKGGEVDELRTFRRALSPLEIRQLHDGNSLSSALANAQSHRDELLNYYLASVDPQTRQARATLCAARQKLVEVEDPIQEIPVMQELPAPRPAYILARGVYDAPKTDENRVQRDTFESILGEFPEDAPRDRLGLAQWVTNPDHPLTARVFVNRMWTNFFGRGLVATPENFGRQGALPTHPELLDWLARDFVDHGWDVKRLCRQIMLSAAYQQDSRLRPESQERDPENQLLARGPSRRLSGEEIRDVALAASELLERQQGGPPVSPYQPGEDLWQESNAMSPEYKQSTGKSLYRRSLYSVWKRTAPLPNMSAFDAPTREVCVVSRSRTSTPLQALVLLNDVQFVEAARALAASVAEENESTKDQISAAFLRLAGRKPDATEQSVLEQVFASQKKQFEAGGEHDAAKFIALGDSKTECKLTPAELAALTATCQVILNLDATIYER